MRNIGFWRKLFFTGNINKMRSALMKFLTSEGIENNMKDGEIIFNFNDSTFSTNFYIHDDFAECEIIYGYAAEEYEQLPLEDKTFIADKTNTDVNNHATLLAFNDNITCRTTFYFTNKSMMLNLFCSHFDELKDCISYAMEILCSKIEEPAEEEKEEQTSRIGFRVNNDNEDKKVVAKA